ncbi:MAG: AAA family ATPase [bacterium]|nr:AAA family ATPase [bacterium]
MGKILGFRIKNYGTLKDIKMGQTFADSKSTPLGNMVTLIGPSGNGKSSLADAFGFITDCLNTDVETACDSHNRGGFEQLVSQGTEEPIYFELYYRENSNSRPITYELTIGLDNSRRPCVQSERLRQRVQKRGRPLSFLYLNDGKGYAFEGTEGGQDEDTGAVSGEKKEVELNDSRKLGIVTLGTMKQYARIEKFLQFLRSWYLCYFSPDSARQIQSASPSPYLNRTGSNINNVAQYMYRENSKRFTGILAEIQSKIPNIAKIVPVKMPNGQMVLEFYQKGFTKPFYSNRMSDGTLKLFAYYLLMNENNPRQLVFIEEPENGLYHQYLAALALELTKNAGSGYTKQIFVTTHSPFFVNALHPEQIWVLEKDESGFSAVKQASEYDFVKDMTAEGAQPGDLWNSRFFG